MKPYHYLALGDSYTIGEQVPLHQSFPYQTVQMLRKKGYNFLAPEIVAVTGYTTDELNQLINETLLPSTYDFVSLLIGVNNQYRGRSVENFTAEFETLLQRALGFAGNHSNHVVVLSIPDWGVTPFATGRDRDSITHEINKFNAVCSAIATQYQVPYIDITDSQRSDGHDESFLAADKLHPSGKEYTKWASALSEKIITVIKN